MVAALVAATFGLMPQFESDARLRTPVSIEAPIITLGDALRRISVATGVKLTLSDNLAKRKATIFVQSRPSAELVASMADTFNLTLSESNGGYAVARTREASNDEAESARRDSVALHSALDRYLSGLAEKSGLTRNQVAQEESKFSKDLTSLGADTRLDAKIKREAIKFQLQVLSTAQWSGVARVLLDLQPSTDEALEAGSTLITSTRPTDDFPHLGDDVRQHLEPGDEAIGIMRVNTARACYEGNFITMGTRTLPSGDVIKQAGLMSGAYFNLLENDIEHYPEVGHCRAWAARSDESLRNVKPEVEQTRPRAVVQTLADVLASLHKRMATPIVSDAYRVPCSLGWTSDDSVQEVLAKIAAFSVMRFPKGEVVFRSRDGWIEGRHIQNWRLQAREIPEPTLAPLEATVAKGQRPSVDQFAEFAALINQPQLDGLNDSLFPTIVHFPSSVMRAVNSLRIWSLLSDTQRASARSREGLLLATGDDTQVARVVENLRAMLWTVQPNADQIPILLGDPAALKRTKLFLTVEAGRTMEEPSPISAGDGEAPRPPFVDAEMVIFQYGERHPGSLMDLYGLPKPRSAGRSPTARP